MGRGLLLTNYKPSMRRIFTHKRWGQKRIWTAVEGFEYLSLTAQPPDHFPAIAGIEKTD